MVNGSNRRGYKDWIAQRATALLIGGYSVFLLFYLVLTPDLAYEQWVLLFSHVWMRVLTVLVLLAVCWHAWIGLWTILTDYVKCGVARMILQVGIIVLLAGYVIWCLDVLWV